LNLRLRLFIEDGLLFSLLVFDVLFDDCVFNRRLFSLLDFELNSAEKSDAENEAPHETMAKNWVFKSAILKEIAEHCFPIKSLNYIP
jgi:hypothetical protein